MMLILKEKILVYTITIYHAWDIREQAPGSCGLDIQNPQKAGYSDFSLCNPGPSTRAWGRKKPRALWATWPGGHSDEQASDKAEEDGHPKLSPDLHIHIIAWAYLHTHHTHMCTHTQ